MILFQAINSLKNYLKDNSNSQALLERDNNEITIDGMEGYWIPKQWLFQKTKFNLKTNKEGDVIYLKEGTILFIDKNKTLQGTKNLEQIKFLRWHGKLIGQVKVGKWYCSWKGQILNVGGFYNDKGLQIGKWIELFENYWDKSQVTYVGEYQNGMKFGKWNAQQVDQKLKQIIIIGGGCYDQFGYKYGQWVDLHNNYYDGRQVIYIGEYYNSLKQGQWNISLKSYFDNRFKRIGGGKYNEEGYKIGKWIEESENFWNGSQILEKGEYRNGIKIGLWESFVKGYKDDIYKLSGLGNYNQKSKKQGKWIEYDEKFKRFKNWKVGNFKLRKWECYVENSHQIVEEEAIITKMDQKQVFGQNQRIIRGSSTIIFQQGLYKNGIKIDKWEIKYKDKLIGGGYYNERGQKFGNWIEIYDKYWEYCKLVFLGNYQDGIKIGEWQIQFQDFYSDKINQIGNGIYDLNGIKVGQWTEVSEKFWDHCQITYEGYYKNGIKFGRWDEFCCLNEKNELIGGGRYDKDGVKFGQWIELHEYFSYSIQIIFVGTYSNGIREKEFVQKKLQIFN